MTLYDRKLFPNKYLNIKIKGKLSYGTVFTNIDLAKIPLKWNNNIHEYIMEKLGSIKMKYNMIFPNYKGKVMYKFHIHSNLCAIFCLFFIINQPFSISLRCSVFRWLIKWHILQVNSYCFDNYFVASVVVAIYNYLLFNIFRFYSYDAVYTFKQKA